MSRLLACSRGSPTPFLCRVRPWRTAAPASSRLFGATPRCRDAAFAPPSRTPRDARLSLDDEVARLAARPLYPLSLADLVRHGPPPLTADQLLASARFTLSLLPVRLARRIRALRNLPYIVVSNPNIRRIFDNYTRSLSTLLPYQGAGGSGALALDSLADEARFTEVLAELVRTHTDTIPALAKGFLECRRYMMAADATRFLDEHLRARIGTRLVAEQHIALHYSSLPALEGRSGQQQAPSHLAPAAAPSSYIGVIDTALRPATIIDAAGGFVADMCELEYGVRPEWVIDGEPDTTFAHVPMHLEYVVTELLKNAFRAPAENTQRRARRRQATAGMGHGAAAGEVHLLRADPAADRPHPVVITIAPEPSSWDDAANDVSSTTTAGTMDGSHTPAWAPLNERCPGVTIRIRDRGGGIEPDILPHIWSYSFTTFRDDDSSAFPFGSSSPNWNTSSSGGAGGLGYGGDGDALSGLIAGANGGVGAAGSAAGMSVGVGGTSSIAGLGYGLPLSRAYAEHFGGEIAVQSLYGWGTDVYLRLKGVGAGGVHK